MKRRPAEKPDPVDATPGRVHVPDVRPVPIPSLQAFRAMVAGMTCIVVAKDLRQAQDLLQSHAPVVWRAATIEPAGTEHLPTWPCVVIPSRP